VVEISPEGVKNMLCVTCGMEESKEGACDHCRQDWDQAMEDLFDVLDDMGSKEAYDVVGRSLFQEKKVKSFDESDDLRG